MQELTRPEGAQLSGDGRGEHPRTPPLWFRSGDAHATGPLAPWRRSLAGRTRRILPRVTFSSPSEPPGCTIATGTARVFFAFDVGHAIDLDLAESALGAAAQGRAVLSGRRRTPLSLQFQPAPVQVSLRGPSHQLGTGGRWHTGEAVELTLFDFGAVSVAYAIAIAETSLQDLVPLAADLYESATLAAHARATVTDLVATVGAAVSRPHLAAVSEDYVVYQLEALRHADGATGSAALARHATDLARILRAADEPLSASEVEDALACAIAYGHDDAVWIDWNAAMVLDVAPNDTLAVLEFANVQLLEMRFLDDRLDAFLDRAYQLVGQATTASHRLRERERRRLAQFQFDSVMLFESTHNAIKLVGDQYLARIHRLAARRSHLPEWGESIERKLDALQRLYEKLADQQATRRMEAMELIIILLILVSIVLPYFGLGK